jgi:hypothetical protein
LQRTVVSSSSGSSSPEGVIEVAKDCSAFIFKVRQSWKTRLGVPDPEDEDTDLSKRRCYQSTRRNIREDLNFQHRSCESLQKSQTYHQQQFFYESMARRLEGNVMGSMLEGET